jgi:hypothetical protein
LCTRVVSLVLFNKFALLVKKKKIKCHNAKHAIYPRCTFQIN